MEDAFIVQGGIPLKGEIELSGAKNVALKVAIASLMFENPVCLKNIPKIKDIIELLRILKFIGAKIDFDNNCLCIDPSAINKFKINLLQASKTRVSFMLFAPFLYRFGKAQIPNPGGCRIGARPINRQIEMMKAFGVNISYDSSTGYYQATLKKTKPKATKYKFTKPTHTGTELAILFGLISQGQSVIENAALEPEIDDLIKFLGQSGASIKKKNSTIIINGQKKLRQKNNYSIMHDRNEAPTFAVFALATRGDILVKGADKNNLKYFLNCLDKVNAGYKVIPGGIRFYYKGKFRSLSITTKPHPGFMTDWQAPWAVLMTQANGNSTVHETIFENRFGYVPQLRKLGAKIDFFAPSIKNPETTYQFDVDFDDKFDNSNQAIKIYGPVKLHGGVVDVTDMRAGASLVIAATAAQGETVINKASEIDRGYQKIELKLKDIGASIKRV